MLVENKGARDLEAYIRSAKHKVSAKGESSSAKSTDYFLIPGKSYDAVSAAEGVFPHR